jgi:hypothetical protein
MGQFMGYASYDLKTRCGICGEVGPREDMYDHSSYCQGAPEGEEPDEDDGEDEGEE